VKRRQRAGRSLIAVNVLSARPQWMIYRLGYEGSDCVRDEEIILTRAA
jgi:hypothetical protein